MQMGFLKHVQKLSATRNHSPNRGWSKLCCAGLTREYMSIRVQAGKQITVELQAEG
jgi:hypothetical protein